MVADDICDRFVRSQGRNPYTRRNVLIAAPIFAALAVLYFFVDPAEVSFMPKCIFRLATGWECPGCGSQRLVHALLHGRIAEAWGYNPFLLLMLPLLVFMVWLEAVRKRRARLYARFYNPYMPLVFAVLLVGWTVVRNLCL